MTKKRPPARRSAAKPRRSVGKKAAGKPRRDAKKTPRKATRKAAVPKAGVGTRRSALVAEAGGIGLITAGQIVQDAIPGGPHDIDSTLENAGLITEGQRIAFRTSVVDGVSAHGATIDGDAVPNAASTTLRDARRAVQQNAH